MSRVPCGSRTRLASLVGWCICRSAKGTCREAEGEGVEPSRPLSSSRFERGAIANWLALPFSKGSGGRDRTSNHRLNRPPPYRLATPDRASQDGRIRTDDLVRPRHAESQTFLRPESRAPSGSRTGRRCAAVGLPPWQSSRLPLRHGRLVGGRIVKTIRAPGGTRYLVAALRVRCLGR